MKALSSVARLKIVLEDVKPVVMRRVEVPLKIRLDRLHATVQTVMGWTDSHLYEFRIRDIGFGIPDPDWGFGGGPIDARKTTLAQVIEDTGAKSFKYLYDFGDGWEHSIRIERIEVALPGFDYPYLLSASGRCPPEDVGGPWGYREFLDARADPHHQRHDEMIDWGGENFDPNAVDLPEIEKALARLASKWSRKPRQKQ